MKQFYIIAFTHRNLGLDAVGQFHVEVDKQVDRFKPIRKKFSIKEFMMISTCNRVEFFIRSTQEVTDEFLQQFLDAAYPSIEQHTKRLAIEKARIYHGLDAIRHLFHVSSSLDSLIVGEREIITQVRQAYELANSAGMTGHFIRISIQKAIECAKQVYTETNIATKPISVVNLGYHQLLDRNLNEDQSVAFIGAGQTIEAIAGNLKKFNFKQTRVFNRTAEKAEQLAKNLNGEGFGLDQLKSKLVGFDVLITCTGSEQAIVDVDLFKHAYNGSNNRKVVLDLAVPQDIHPDVIAMFNVDYISVESLREIAKANLKTREKEVFRCEELVEQRLAEFVEVFRTRKLELAMQKVPSIMKEIKTNAIEKAFASRLMTMSDEDREITLEMLNYLEKKYVSVPMKIAKEVILDQDLKDSVSE